MNASQHTPARRAVLAGAAWSVPIITVAVAAPAKAASTPCTEQSLAAINIIPYTQPGNQDANGEWEHTETVAYNVNPDAGEYLPDMRVVIPDTRADGSVNWVTNQATGETTQGLNVVISRGEVLHLTVRETNQGERSSLIRLFTIPPEGTCVQEYIGQSTAARKAS